MEPADHNQGRRAGTGHLGEHTEMWQQGREIGVRAAQCHPLLIHQASSSSAQVPSLDSSSISTLAGEGMVLTTWLRDFGGTPASPFSCGAAERVQASTRAPHGAGSAQRGGHSASPRLSQHLLGRHLLS